MHQSQVSRWPNAPEINFEVFPMHLSQVSRYFWSTSARYPSVPNAPVMNITVFPKHLSQLSSCSQSICVSYLSIPNTPEPGIHQYPKQPSRLSWCSQHTKARYSGVSEAPTGVRCSHLICATYPGFRDTLELGIPNTLGPGTLSRCSQSTRASYTDVPETPELYVCMCVVAPWLWRDSRVCPHSCKDHWCWRLVFCLLLKSGINTQQHTHYLLHSRNLFIIEKLFEENVKGVSWWPGCNVSLLLSRLLVKLQEFNHTVRVKVHLDK